jgi:hypothetical protein
MSSGDYYGGPGQQNQGYGAPQGQQGHNQGYPPQNQGYGQQSHDQYGGAHSPYPPQGQVSTCLELWRIVYFEQQ